MLRLHILTGIFCCLATTAPLAAQNPTFSKDKLTGGPTIVAPTSLQFGPGGRLFVAERFGKLHVLTVTRQGPGQYNVIASELITKVFDKPNRRDDGSLQPAFQGRQITGLLVTGSASSPVLYVTSSDPRTAVGADTGLDTNSGILHRLTWARGDWQIVDLVRGLPRSEENHGPNGMALDEARQELYLAQGGNTNMGAPSTNFGQLPEYAYSAAILRVDLAAIGNSTYDLPTLDDPSRPNVGGRDVNDPFGGNDGANQAMLEAGGPVQVWAPGYRNPYDVLIHSSGRVYTVDNGANQGWGGIPIGCGNTLNDSVFPSANDSLQFVGWLGSQGGDYGGHPNPVRANRSNTFGGQSPVPPGMENPQECGHQGPASNGSLHDWPISTNGLVEYTSSNFGGAMQGELLTVGLNSGELLRIGLDSGGGLQHVTTVSSYVGNLPLDVTTQGSGGEFPGTIWVACFGENAIYVLEPDDLLPCQGTYDFGIDEDGDGFSNGDEIDNGTDPCSAADHPLDRDGDGLADAVDPDDDGDGIDDVDDAFAIDATNGLSRQLPFNFNWSPGDPGTGLLGLGFTGLMTNGVDEYIDLFDPALLTAGGAAGKLTLDAVTDGSPRGSSNDLTQGFQLGISVDSGTGPFTVHTRLDSPFFNGRAAVADELQGFFLGTGDQDHFLELVHTAGGFQMRLEEGGGTLFDRHFPASTAGVSSIDLYLTVDPDSGLVRARYRLDGGCYVNLGETLALQGTLLARLRGPAAIALGLLASHGANGQPFACTFDSLAATQTSAGGSALLLVAPSNSTIEADSLGFGSFILRSTATNRRIVSACLDFSSALLSDLVVDIDGTAGDTTGKGFTADSGAPAVGYTGHSLTGPKDSGFTGVHIDFDDFDSGETFKFSLDLDPTSIRGTTAPGPSGAGRVSGLELSGTRITLVYDDGSIVRGELFASASSQSHAWSRVNPGRLAAPALHFVDTEHPVLEQPEEQAQLIVTGPAGTRVRLLLVQAELALTGNGFDIDPFETNHAVSAAHVTSTFDENGEWRPVVFLPTDPDQSLQIMAVAVADDGTVGDVSSRITLARGTGGGQDPDGPDPGNDQPPHANDDTLTIPYSSLVVIPVLANDIDDGLLDPGTVTLLQQPVYGTAWVDTAGLVHYQHNGSDGTQDLMTYTVADDAGQLSNEALITIHLDSGGPAGPRVIYRVNAGGGTIQDPAGVLDWSADTLASPSPYLNAPGTTGTFAVSNSIQLANNLPAGTPPSLFQTERWGQSSSPTLSWAFPIAHPTAVEVRLYFCEIFLDQPFARRFNPLIEGLTGRQVDPFLEARGAFKGYMRSIRTRVTDGVLNIDLHQVLDGPNIQAIEIIDFLPR